MLIVHASKSGNIKHELSYQSPVLAVAKARGFTKTGWDVHIANSEGQRFPPDAFDTLLEFRRAQQPRP